MKNNSLIIRVDESKKIDFKVALLRQRLCMQTIIEAFIDDLVAHDQGKTIPYIEKLVKKSQE